MRAGIPVVASNAGPLPEVLGDAALLIDPGDADELASSLARVLDDEQLRRQLSERGRARVARYGWDGSVERFAATYRALGRR
jgi:glycosyltransferase involved in cell wall biosynthesis